MAISDLIVRIVGDTKGLSTGLAKAEADLGKFGIATSGAGAKVAAFGRLSSATMGGLSTVGVAALGAIGVASLKTASDFEDAHVKLTTAAKASAKDFGDLGDAVSEADNRMVGLGFSTTETEQAIAALVVPLHSVSKAADAVGLAADIARFKNQSLADATSTLVKIEAGRFRGLAALGVSTKGLGTDQASIAEAIRRTTVAVQGQAEAFAKDTIAGKVAVISAEFKRLEVQVGTGLVPVLERITGTLHGLTSGIQETDKHTDGLLGKIGKFATSNDPFLFFKKGVDELNGAAPSADEKLQNLKDHIQGIKDAIALDKGNPKVLALEMQALAAAEAKLPGVADKAAAATDRNVKAEKAAAKVAKDASQGIYSLASAYALLGATVNNNVVGSIKNFNTAAHANLDATQAAKSAGSDLLTTIAGLSGAQDDAAGSTQTAASAMFDQIGKVNTLRDAQQGAKDATFDLAAAQRDNANATQDAKDAEVLLQRVLHGYAADSIKAGDASENLSKARLAEKSANLDITDAERNLTKARRTGNARDIARAEIQLSQAKLGAKDASRDAAEAQRIYNGTLHGFAANSAEARAAQDKLTGAQDTAHQAAVTLREAYDTMHDSLQDVKHAQLDLKGAFDSGASSGKKLKSTLDDVIQKSIEFGDKTSERVARGSGSLIQGFRAEIDLLTGLAAATPGLGHAFDEVIANLRRDIATINAQNGVGGRKAVFRAAGGPLDAGQLSVVGERGPELFVPRSAGTVIPNGAGGNVTHFHTTLVVAETDGGDRIVRKWIAALNSGSGKADARRALGIPA